MSKFMLMAPGASRDGLLREIQRFGQAHFKNLSQDEAAGLDFVSGDYSGEYVSEIEGDLARLDFAIGRVRPFVSKPTGLKGLTAPATIMSFEEFDGFAAAYDYQAACGEIKSLDERLKTCAAERAALAAENRRLESWIGLDVTAGDLNTLKSVKYFTVTADNPEGFREAFESRYPACYIEFFGKTKDGSAGLIIAPAGHAAEIAAELRELGCSPASMDMDALPAKTVEANRRRARELAALEAEQNARLESYTDEYGRLQTARDYFNTLLERARVRENFLRLQGSEGVDDVVMLEGWSPKAEIGALEAAIYRACGGQCYFETEDVPRDSGEVPIKLKNNRFVSAFEDITAMYSMPRYNEIDPTPVMAPFYLAFFGLMVGDAGYGLVIVLATALALKYFNLKEGSRNFMRFFNYLGYAVILAGFLYGSAFGFPFFTPLTGADGAPKAILDSQADITTMIVLSIVYGVVHVMFGLCVKGYMLLRDRKWLDAIFDSLFWIVAVMSLIGLILGVAGFIPTGLKEVCKWALGISLVGLAVTQGREYPSLAGKIGGGLYGVYGITSYVGDLVSYTRIAALMLSGAYIGYSFNLIAGLMPAGIIRIVFGGVIVIFGALLNMGLSLLGAYVHTCRLQYVEFFSKFYDGGGKPFKPFGLKNNYINISK